MQCICKICSNEYKLGRGFSYHLSRMHDIVYKDYYDLYIKSENEGKCKICNKDTKFDYVDRKYKDCCSSKCTCLYKYGVEHNSQIPEVKQKMHTKESVQKMKQTNIERYGVSSQFKREEVRVKSNIASHSEDVERRRKNTIREKYGVDSILQVKEIHEKGVEASKSKQVRDKIKETNLLRYGVVNPMNQLHVIEKMKSDETKNKRMESIKKTNIERYGVEFTAKLEEVKQKQAATNYAKYGVSSFLETDECREASNKLKQEIIRKFTNDGYTTRAKLIDTYGQGWLSLNIPEIIDHKIAFISNDYINTIEEYYNRERKSHYNSIPENEIYEYITSIYNGKVKRNNRSIIYPLEVDIYLPEFKIAIEVNGTYWHSTENKGKTYHMNKSLMCENFGIRLIHVYEWEWTNNTEYIKQLIYNAIFEYHTYHQIEEGVFEVVFDTSGISLEELQKNNSNFTIHCDYNKGYIDIDTNKHYTGPNVFNIPPYTIYGSGNIIYTK